MPKVTGLSQTRGAIANRAWRQRWPDKAREYQRRKQQEWRDAHPGYHRFRRYGITPEQQSQMLIEQNGLCAICKTNGATHMDHDHKSGRIRGIICNDCNIGLGRFRDDPAHLAAAAAYLTVRKVD